MTQTVVGVSAFKPVYERLRWLNLGLFAEANGRFISLRGNHSESSPSIEALYDNTTAPGLARQPTTAQFTEGVHIGPVIKDYVQLDYSGKFQQFAGESDASFLGWSIDLNHTFYLYGFKKPHATEPVGPDSCARWGDSCPPLERTRNLNGSIGLRVLLTESITSGSDFVPFYFQPTLGGSDINSFAALSSYQDYRFRAPNLMLWRASFEHSIWGPFGFSFLADEGKVAVARSDVDFNHLKHSFAAGLTLRAGGFPMVYVMFAWGGKEGNHTIFNMNSSLLGGSARPLLD
jgi:hypothetical protein